MPINIGTAKSSGIDVYNEGYIGGKDKECEFRLDIDCLSILSVKYINTWRKFRRAIN